MPEEPADSPHIMTPVELVRRIVYAYRAHMFDFDENLCAAQVQAVIDVKKREHAQWCAEVFRTHAEQMEKLTLVRIDIEREACAKIADEVGNSGSEACVMICREISGQIRARGKS